MKIQTLTRKIQKNFIRVSLFFIYIVGFGITLIFVKIFHRKLLKDQNSRSNQRKKNTFWKKADGYSPKIDECLKQL